MALARAGAAVALLARTSSHLADVADAVKGEGRAALPVACDLADAASLERAAEQVRA